MDSNKAVFARNLCRHMEEKRKTRSDVCHDLGLRYSTFAEWCTGLKYPRIDKIEMLANYFGIEKSDLIEEKQPIIDGLSEKTIMIARLVDNLPEKYQSELLDRLQAFQSAQSNLDDLLKYE